MDAFAAYLLFINANHTNDKIVLAITKKILLLKTN